MGPQIARVIAGILLGAVTEHADNGTEIFVDAARQLHWVFYDLESKWTRRDRPVDLDWIGGGYQRGTLGGRLYVCTAVGARIE